MDVSKVMLYASKVMLKILQARLQQYVNREIPDVQAGFRKGRGTRDQIANIIWIIKKARKYHKNIYFHFIDYTKSFDCVGHKKEPMEIRKSAQIHWLSGKCKVKPKCNCKGMGEQNQKILNIVKNVKQWQCFPTVVGSVN